MTKLTETQSIILTAGAQRPDNIALPLPKGLAGAAAKMAVTKMMMRGWLQEVDANLRRGEPLWRETGDGHGTTLVVTDAGLLAIGIEPVVVKTADPLHEHTAEAPAVKTPTPRKGTKQAALISMLRAPDGHLVPLKRVAVLTRTEGAAEITRHDLTPAVSVSARIDGRGFSAAIHDVRQALATPGLLPAGVHYQLAGLYLQQQQAFAGLIQVFIAAALLVFLALLFLYEQFRMALAIMVAPLLAVGGVFTGLWLAGQTLNITALMGMIMIVGIVTEVAVFYFSELAVLRQNHRGAAHPLSLSMLIDAGSNRMRPILMTTLAAILALLPCCPWA
ncbi:MAG: hypothetical protein B7Y53_09210 [Halothiobacillus sp. 28-55-5]|nr:MAG: hypothetical protein B7Y53_09210 [Halothiobacillus sp. 28-55-5]